MGFKKNAVFIVFVICLLGFVGCSKKIQEKNQMDVSHQQERKEVIPQKPSPAPTEIISEEEKKEVQTNDRLEVISTIPECPAFLTVRDLFKVRVRYEVNSVDGVLIFISAFNVDEEDAQGSTSASYDHPRGVGEVELFISYKQPQHLRKILLTMEDSVTRSRIFQMTYPVDVLWQEKVPTTADRIEVIATDPLSRSTLNLGEKFYVKVKYVIDSVQEAFIEIRPCLMSSPATYLESPAKTCPRGEGTMVGSFSFDSSIHVSEIMVVMKNKVSGESICEEFLEVDLRWE